MGHMKEIRPVRNPTRTFLKYSLSLFQKIMNEESDSSLSKEFDSKDETEKNSHTIEMFDEEDIQVETEDQKEDQSVTNIKNSDLQDVTSKKVGFICDQCDYSTKHKSNLNIHQKVKHEKRVYKCINC